MSNPFGMNVYKPKLPEKIQKKGFKEWIYSILKTIYSWLEEFAKYFAYLQKPGINVIVSILGIYILGNFYQYLAKQYYSEYKSTLYSFCIGQWALLIILFIVFYTLTK